MKPPLEASTMGWSWFILIVSSKCTNGRVKCRDPLSAAVQVESPAQEFDALHRNLIASRFDAPPNGGRSGDHFHIGREGLDDDIAFVADLFECFGDGLPVNMIAARCATIAAARVKMAQKLAGLANRRGLVLLFDVHVEGIQVKLE